MKRMCFAATLTVLILLSFCRGETAGDEFLARLPRSVVPRSYRLDINTIFQGKNITSHGEVWIDIELTETTNEIVLNSKGLKVIKQATSLELLTPSAENFGLTDKSTWENTAIIGVEHKQVKVDKNISEPIESATVFSPRPSHNERDQTELQETLSDKTTEKFPWKSTSATESFENSKGSVIQGNYDQTTPGIISLRNKKPKPRTEQSFSQTLLREPSISSPKLDHKNLKTSNHASTLEPDSDRIVGSIDTIKDKNELGNRSEITTNTWLLLDSSTYTNTHKPSLKVNPQNPVLSAEVIDSDEDLERLKTTSVSPHLNQDFKPITHTPSTPSESTSESDGDEILGNIDRIKDKNPLFLNANPSTSTHGPSSEINPQKPVQNPGTVVSSDELESLGSTSVWSLLNQDPKSSTGAPSIHSSGSSSNPPASNDTTNSVLELMHQVSSSSTHQPVFQSSSHLAASSDPNQSQTETSMQPTTSGWSLLYQTTNASELNVYSDLDTRKPDSSGSIQENSSFTTFTSNHFHTTESPEEAFGDNSFIPIDDVSIDKDKDFLIVKLKKNLHVGKRYRLRIRFTGVLETDVAGYYKIPYEDKSAKQTRWITSTVFEPMEARRAFPCFDEPYLKAKFQVNLMRPKSMTSLSNTQLRRTYAVDGQPDLEVDSFEETPLMSTYLVAFHVGNLAYREASATRSGKPFRVYAQPTVLKYTDYVLDVGPRFQNFLENYLQVEEPLNKTDLLALPLHLGDALENWGLISYFDEKSVIYRPGMTSSSNQLQVATVLAHELSHTWFGNLVTMDWWSDIWLNEGFATYFAGLAINHVHPQWDVQSLMTVRSFLRVFSVDSLHTSHPLVRDVTVKANLLHLFDSVSYYKGQYILRMLHHTVGESTFQRGCIRYVKQYMYSNVQQKDFWDIMTKQAHEDGTLPSTVNLTKVMSAWTRKPGFPVVNVIRDYESNTAHVVQNRFLRPKYDLQVRTSDVEDTVWWIPLTYTTQAELNFNDTKPRLWIEPQELITTVKNLPGKDQWIMFNIQATGFYRINYDMQNWELITRYLQSSNYKKISVVNRAQIIDDVFNFARAGDVPYSVALNITKYLRNEHHYLPWMSVLNNLAYISGMLKTTNRTREFQHYVQELLKPEFDHLGLESRTEDTLIQSINRQQIVSWACQTGLKECVQEAVAQYHRWVDLAKGNSSIENPIAGDVREAVYCTAIEHGGEQEWEFLWQRYLQPSVDADQLTMLAALGCSKDPQILKRYLEMTIKENSGLNKVHSVDVFKAIVKNDVGENLAKKFFIEKFNDIKAYNGKKSRIHLPELVDTLASKMNHESQLNEFEEFQRTHTDNFRDAKYSLNMFNDKIRSNIEWLKRNYAPISNWLQSEKANNS